MVKFFWAVTLALLLVSVNSPAYAQTKPVTEQSQLSLNLKGAFPAIHDVAVLSALGRRIAYSKIGFWDQKSRIDDIASWGLDDQIIARIKLLLAKRFVFHDVGYDAAALGNIKNGEIDRSDGKLATFLKSVPHDGIDAFIIVRSELQFKAPGPEGLGLITTDGSLNDHAPALWANYEIDMVDANNGEIIGRAYSSLRRRPDNRLTLAAIPLANSFNLGDNLAMTAEQTVALRRQLLFLINDSLVETLRALDFGVDLPPPGARFAIPIPPDKSPYRGFKTVAVVSGLSDKIAFESLEPLFVHGHYTTSIEGWQVDRIVEQNLGTALMKPFTLLNADVDRAAFSKASLLDASGRYAPTFPGLRPVPNLDLYVLVIPVPLPVNGSTVSGIGVTRSGSEVFGKHVVVAAHFAIVAVDAHTMKVVAYQVGASSPDKASEDPEESVDVSFWPNVPEAPTVAEIAALRQPVMNLLGNAIAETLLRMGLLGVVSVDAGLVPAKPMPAISGQ